MMPRRASDRARLFTQRGCEWSDRYPRIICATRALKATSTLIDGEAVWSEPVAVMLDLANLLGTVARPIRCGGETGLNEVAWRPTLNDRLQAGKSSPPPHERGQWRSLARR
jgi:hypothetical protein